jgi:hypothetical protein
VNSAQRRWREDVLLLLQLLLPVIMTEMSDAADGEGNALSVTRFEMKALAPNIRRADEDHASSRQVKRLFCSSLKRDCKLLLPPPLQIDSSIIANCSLRCDVPMVTCRPAPLARTTAKPSVNTLSVLANAAAADDDDDEGIEGEGLVLASGDTKKKGERVMGTSNTLPLLMTSNKLPLLLLPMTKAAQRFQTH